MTGRPSVVLVWAGSMAAVAAVTAAGWWMGLNASTVGFLYLIAVLLVSLWGGLLAGTIASVVATLCYNFFFFSPLFTLTLADPANWFALAAFLISSVTVSRLVVAARVQRDAAEQRRRELGTLYGLSADLFAAVDRGTLEETAGRALQLLGATGGGLELFDGATPRDEKPVEIASAHGRDVVLPLIIGGKHVGAFVARGTTASMHALESAASLLALAVERQRLVEESARMEALRESEALKTSLLRAISHDLTTPITAITVRLESLRRRAVGDDELRDVARAIAEETERLRRRIDNLLSMARLEAGRAQPHPEPTPPADLFRAARENLPQVSVTVHVDADCPDANVDPSLALEILVNLVENAHRVSPPGAPIELVARRHPVEPDKLRIEVLDRGPGLPPGAADADVAQRGLGLEIARSLAAANGGSIGLAPRAGGGTVARIDLPAAPLPVEERA
jgi:two-component system sensor histidine kinase KdpD